MTGIQDVNSDVDGNLKRCSLGIIWSCIPITAETGTLFLISASAGRMSRHDDEPTRSCSTNAVNRPRERSWSMALTTVLGEFAAFGPSIFSNPRNWSMSSTLDSLAQTPH